MVVIRNVLKNNAARSGLKHFHSINAMRHIQLIASRVDTLSSDVLVVLGYKQLSSYFAQVAYFLNVFGVGQPRAMSPQQPELNGSAI